MWRANEGVLVSGHDRRRSQLLDRGGFLYLFEEDIIRRTVLRVFADVQELNAPVLVDDESRRMSDAIVLFGVEDAV